MLGDGGRFLFPDGPAAVNASSLTTDELTAHLRSRLHEVRRRLGLDPVGEEAETRPLGTLLDSMGLVEFLVLVANDCGVTVEALEAAVNHQFDTLPHLAAALHAAGLPLHNPAQVIQPAPARRPGTACWLAGVVAR